MRERNRLASGIDGVLALEREVGDAMELTCSVAAHPPLDRAVVVRVALPLQAATKSASPLSNRIRPAYLRNPRTVPPRVGMSARSSPARGRVLVSMSAAPRRILSPLCSGDDAE